MASDTRLIYPTFQILTLTVFVKFDPTLKVLLWFMRSKTHPSWPFSKLTLQTTTTTTILWPFVRDYPGEPVPEETFTH